MNQKRIFALALALIMGLALVGCSKADVKYDGTAIAFEYPGDWKEVDAASDLSVLGSMGTVADQIALQYGNGQNACIMAVIEGAGADEVIDAYKSAYDSMEGRSEGTATVGDITFDMVSFTMSGMTNTVYITGVDGDMVMFNFTGTGIGDAPIDSIKNLTMK